MRSKLLRRDQQEVFNRGSQTTRDPSLRPTLTAWSNSRKKNETPFFHPKCVGVSLIPGRGRRSTYSLFWRFSDPSMCGCSNSRAYHNHFWTSAALTYLIHSRLHSWAKENNCPSSKFNSFVAVDTHFDPIGDFTQMLFVYTFKLKDIMILLITGLPDATVVYHDNCIVFQLWNHKL